MSPASYLTAPPRVATGSIPADGGVFLGRAWGSRPLDRRRRRVRGAPRVARLAVVRVARRGRGRGRRAASDGGRAARVRHGADGWPGPGAGDSGRTARALARACPDPDRGGPP